MIRNFSRWIALGSIVACLLSACALGNDTPNHAFSFDAVHESPEARILNYQYGNSRQPGAHPPDWALSSGQVAQGTNINGAMLRGDFLSVKWQIKRTGQIYEDRVDLRHHLPSDLSDYRIHFVVNGPQLYVYLISPEKITGHCPATFQEAQQAIKTRDPHDTVLFMYCDLKITLIYPDQQNRNATTGPTQ